MRAVVRETAFTILAVFVLWIGLGIVSSTSGDLKLQNVRPASRMVDSTASVPDGILIDLRTNFSQPFKALYICFITPKITPFVQCEEFGLPARAVFNKEMKLTSFHSLFTTSGQLLTEGTNTEPNVILAFGISASYGFVLSNLLISP